MPASALGIFVITNASDVHTNGVELELAYAPSQRLSVSGGVTYLNAGYEFKGPCYMGQTAALGCSGGQQNLSNGTFVNAPEFRYTILTRYTQPVSSTFAVYAQVNFRWQSEVQFSYDQDPRFIQPAYGIADFKLDPTCRRPLRSVGVREERVRYALRLECHRAGRRWRRCHRQCNPERFPEILWRRVFVTSLKGVRACRTRGGGDTRLSDVSSWAMPKRLGGKTVTNSTH